MKEITLHPKQSEVFRDKHRFKVVVAGRRFGKTTLALTLLLNEIYEGRNRQVWYVAPSYRQAKQIAWEMLNKLVPKGDLVKPPHETELIFYFKDNNKLCLKGADNPDSLRGVGLNYVVLDETANIKRNVWEEVIRPTLLDSGGKALFIGTPKGYNHFYDFFLMEQKNEDWKSWQFKTIDNPFIAKKEIEDAKGDSSPERFAQEYEAEFSKRFGTIWSRFDRIIHLTAPYIPDNSHTFYGSLDFGFSIGHPTAFQLHHINNQGEVCTFDGFTEEGLNIDRVDEIMKAKAGSLPIKAVFYDPSRPDLAEDLRKKGWNMIPAMKDVEVGIAKVDEYMAVNPLTSKPLWSIVKVLVRAIEQIENYHWMEIRGEDNQYKQAPDKIDDDNPDALRYFLYTYSQRHLQTQEEKFDEWQSARATKHTGYV